MTDTTEVLITSDASTSGGSIFSSCVWDIKTGTIIHTYKSGGICTAKTLCHINNDYILACERLKPILHLWPINSQEPLGMNVIRSVLPGKVNTLDVSSNGIYCAAGIDEKLYIWQLSTGRMLAIVNKHFQSITKVLFTNDSTHVVTCGEDGLVMIWALAHLVIATQQNNLPISQSVAGQMDPIHTISDHSMPVKDMYVSKSGARLITVSSDRTMKLYQLFSGQLLLSVVFDVCLSAVLLNHSETNAYIGSVNGDIFELCFLDVPRENKEYHYMNNDKQQSKNSFVGHTKSITCLAMTIDSKTLVSGSVDEQVIVWHVDTKQKLRAIPHKGIITNLHFMITTQNLFNHDFKPTTVVQSFERTTDSTETDQNQFIPVIHKTDKELICNDDDFNDMQWNLGVRNNSTQGDNSNLLTEINKLKAINIKLYQFALDHIINDKKINENKVNENSPKRKRNS